MFKLVGKQKQHCASGRRLVRFLAPMTVLFLTKTATLQAEPAGQIDAIALLSPQRASSCETVGDAPPIEHIRVSAPRLGFDPIADTRYDMAALMATIKSRLAKDLAQDLAQDLAKSLAATRVKRFEPDEAPRVPALGPND